MNRGAFTLMEVIVSVVLLAVIGVALIKLSSANIEGVIFSQESRLDLTSFPIITKDKFARVGDYSKLKDIEIPNLDVDRSSESEIFTHEYQMDTNLTLELKLLEQSVKVGDEGVNYYRFR